MRAPLLIRILLIALYIISDSLCDQPKPFFLESDPAAKGLTKHHIIPGNTLKRFFKAAVDEGKKDKNIEVKLKSSILHIANNIKNDALDKYSLAALEGIKNGHMNLANLKGYAYSLYYWMPANIFMGPNPNCRKGDPGSKFDDNAKYIINDQSKFNTLLNIYMDMEQYSATRNMRYFNHVNQNLKTLRERLPYKYNQKQWVWDANNKCEIRTSAPAQTHSHGHKQNHHPSHVPSYSQSQAQSHSHHYGQIHGRSQNSNRGRGQSSSHGRGRGRGHGYQG